MTAFLAALPGLLVLVPVVGFLLALVVDRRSAPCVVAIEGDVLAVELRPLYRVASLVRSFSVPIGSVVAADRAPDARKRLRGVRVGTGLPAVLLAGKWVGGGEGTDFVLLRKGDKAVCLVLDGQRFRRLLVEVADPDGLLAMLARRGVPVDRKGKPAT